MSEYQLLLFYNEYNFKFKSMCSFGISEMHCKRSSHSTIPHQVRLQSFQLHLSFQWTTITHTFQAIMCLSITRLQTDTIDQDHTCFRPWLICRPITDMDVGFGLSPRSPSNSSTIPTSSVSRRCVFFRRDITVSQFCSSCGMPRLMADGRSQIGWSVGRLDLGTEKSSWSSGLQQAASRHTQRSLHASSYWEST